MKKLKYNLVLKYAPSNKGKNYKFRRWIFGGRFLTYDLFDAHYHRGGSPTLKLCITIEYDFIKNHKVFYFCCLIVIKKTCS